MKIVVYAVAALLITIVVGAHVSSAYQMDGTNKTIVELVKAGAPAMEAACAAGRGTQAQCSFLMGKPSR